MKKKFLFILLIVLSFNAVSQTVCNVSFVYGDAGDNRFSNVFFDEQNNTFYASGRSNGRASFNRIDAQGTMLWTKEYQGISATFTKIVKAPNGDFLLFANPNENFLVVRVDSLGNIIWSRTYSSGRERQGKLIASINDTYIIAGWFSPGGSQDDALVTRIDGTGNIIWSKRYSNHDDQLGGITSNGNGGVVMTGGLHIGGGDLNFFVAEIDVDGNAVNMKEFDLSIRDDYPDIIRTSDGGYLVSGATVIGDWHVFTMKLNPDLSINWVKRFLNNRPSNAILSLTEDINNNFHIATRTNNIATNTPIIVSYDALGNLLQSKSFNGLPWIRANATAGIAGLHLWATPTAASLGQFGSNDGFLEFTDLSIDSCNAFDYPITEAVDTWTTFNWTPTITNFTLGVTINNFTAIDNSYMSNIICGIASSIELGNDVTLCVNEMITLDATVNATATYVWYQDSVELVGQTNPTLDVTTSGVYEVDVIVSPDCTINDSITIQFTNGPVANQPTDLVACDLDGNGVETFDLSLQIPQILDTQNPADFNITFHANQTDANDDLNPLPTMYNGADSETIFVRIESSQVGSNCHSTTMFQLFFNALPVANQPSNIVTCDLDNNGFEIFDLSTQEATILGTQNAADFNITFHNLLTDAVNDINPVATMYNGTNGETIFVRIESTEAGNTCFNTISFDLLFDNPPIVTTPTDLNVCDETPFDGITQIDLNVKSAEIIGTLTGVSVQYYTSQADAASNTNPLASPYTNTSTPETIYVRVENGTTGCFSVTNFDIIVSEAPGVFPTTPLEYCDTDNDGFGIFNIRSTENQITGGMLMDIAVTYHETPEDADNDVNP
ncbi:hypothetical protein H2O64_23785, partial [Kordia sp. YSTF-M3]|nr:hypothetical protein [Kordia aestuariivivens]